MVGKTYLRYREAQHAGVLASPQALYCAAGVFRAGRASAVFPALEAVQVVNIKTGVLEHRLVPERAARGATMEVSSLAVVSLEPHTSSATAAQTASTDLTNGYMILAGYANGHVAVFSSNPEVLHGAHVCKLYALGHKPDTQVLSVAMDSARAMVASGGQDTDITLWDVSSEEPSCRLKGHRGGVVSLAFVPNRPFLISAGADGWVKVWDLNVNQCVQTLVASDSQVTSMCLDSTGMRLYCGLRDNMIRVYAVRAPSSENDDGTTNGENLLTEHGDLARKTNKPMVGLKFSDDGAYLLGWTSKTLEVFRALSADDVKKKVQRKKKRRRTDGEDDEESAVAEDAVAQPTGAAAASATEEIKPLKTFFLEQKIRSATFVPATTAAEREGLQILVTFHNNTALTYTTALTESQVEGASVWTLTDLKTRHQLLDHGHHSDVRHLMFVDEDAGLVTMGKEGLRMWSVSMVNSEEQEEDDETFYHNKEAALAAYNPKNKLSCTGSVEIDDCTTCAGVSSDLICVGTESGAVHLVNVAASTIVTTQSVHVGAVRSVALRPDQSGFTSLGQDRRLVVWTLAMMSDATQSVSLQLTHEIELNDNGLFLEYSKDGKLVAVGLQDNNIQLFYADTWKPFLVLFGHKLPPSGASFSTDGSLIATVGMDKSLRFWGTDFGDCHRAIHAHDEYVTSVQFVPNTHYVFTCSMDGSVKYWDGDNWTMIQRFRLHQRGLWSLAVNSNGSTFASAGTDRCLRLASRTEEILFPQEEEEKMAQEAMDEDAARRAALQKLEDKEAEVGIVGQATTATTDAAEKLMEALDLISVELQRKAGDGDNYQPHLLFRNKSVWEHLWATLDSIRPSELRHAMSALTSTHITALLEFLVETIDSGVVQNYETVARSVLALVAPPPGKTHGRAFISVSGEGVNTAKAIQQLRSRIADGLQRGVDRINFNVAGLKFIMQQATQKDKVRFYDLSKIQGHKKKYNSSAMHN